MHNVEVSFRDKWHRNRDLAFAETLREGSDIFCWILNRNGWADAAALSGYLRNKHRVLDAGCGNGRVTALLRRYSAPETTQIVGIDLVAAQVAAENLAGGESVRFENRDLLSDLSDLGDFDFIYCQEVLHHTEDPRRAFGNLCRLLQPGGEIAIYVYKRKAPAREFVDDYVRDQIADLPYEQAMQACEEIAQFGRSLAEADVRVRVPRVEVLGIEAGEYDLQRFLYHFFMKCFWNPDLSFQENAVINYDWYHPQLCSRHTREEVREWFADEGLTVTHEFVDFYGITMHGLRNDATAESGGTA
jgi:SAM-dependent methyltransferase